MLTLESRVHVAGVDGAALYAFLMNPTDEGYRRWWPGTHLAYHALNSGPGRVGTRLFMDEYIGKRRLKMTAVVVEAQPGRRIVWQLEAILRLPAWVRFTLEKTAEGVTVTHTISAGFSGLGAVLDGLLRLYLNDTFARDMDAHVRTEFPRLGAMLAAAGTPP
jgi:hypothetical protein